jgi:hypothetical protein
MDDDIKPVLCRVEIDIMEPDYNDPTSVKGKKIQTWGGATCAALCVDCASGYLTGKLLKSMGNTVLVVKDFNQYYKLHGHKIKKLASYQIVVSFLILSFWCGHQMRYNI